MCRGMGNATQCYSGFKDHLQEHGTGKHPRLGESHSLPHIMPPAPHCGMQACYFLPFYQREVAFVIRKNNQLMSPQKKLVSAWIRLHSLAGTLGAVLHAARENKGPMPACTPLLSQETFGQWKAETGQLTAPVWGLLCAAPFTLSSCFGGNRAFHLT